MNRQWGRSLTRFGGATVTVTNGGDPVWSLLFGDVQGSAQVVMGLNVDQASATGFGAASVTDGIQRTAYTPYGARRGTEDLDIDRGWLGQVEDTDTGLTYLNARYYDPVLSRFLSPDPLMNPGDPRTLDAYRYAENNPVSFTDASGLRATCASSANDEMSCAGSAANRGVDFHTGGTKVVHSRAKSGRGSGGGTGSGSGSSGSGISKGPQYTQGAPKLSDSLSFTNGMSYEELQGLSPGDKTLVTSTVDCATDVHVGFGQVNDYCSGLLTQAAVRDLRERDGWFNNILAWYAVHSDAITATVAVGGLGVGLAGAGKANAAAAGANRGGAGAENALSGVRLRAQLAGEEIAGGHAFGKHVVVNGEFPGVTTRSGFAAVIEATVIDGEMRTLGGGRTAYWSNGTVVIRDPRAADGGTAFRPRDGYSYFTDDLN
jgi:RHS repeat-associated protein